MDFRIHKPSAALAPLVHSYWTLEGTGSGSETIFPDGRPEIVIHCADSAVCDGVVQPRAILVGQMRGPVTITPGSQIQSFGIRLHPAGAYALLRFSQSEISGQILAFDQVDAGVARALVRAASRLSRRIDSIEQVLASHIRLTPDVRVRAAIDRIAEARGSVTMDQLAAHSEIGARQIERLFQAQVGIDPKTFARIVRFQRVLNSPPQDWASTAIDAGYFDQAHLIRDFRQFAGQTPAAWAERRVAFLQDLPADSR